MRFGNRVVTPTRAHAPYTCPLAARRAISRDGMVFEIHRFRLTRKLHALDMRSAKWQRLYRHFESFYTGSTTYCNNIQPPSEEFIFLNKLSRRRDRSLKSSPIKSGFSDNTEQITFLRLGAWTYTFLTKFSYEYEKRKTNEKPVSICKVNNNWMYLFIMYSSNIYYTLNFSEI